MKQEDKATSAQGPGPQTSAGSGLLPSLRAEDLSPTALPLLLQLGDGAGGKRGQKGCGRGAPVTKAGPGSFGCRAHSVHSAFSSLLAQYPLKSSSNTTFPGERGGGSLPLSSPGTLSPLSVPHTLCLYLYNGAHLSLSLPVSCLPLPAHRDATSLFSSSRF